MKKALLTLLISMVPVVELRGAIPFGVAAGIPVGLSFVIALIGNMIPVPFIILFIRPVFKWFKEKSQWLANIARWFEEKANRNKDKVLKYEFWGLVLLVAIPLPGTGAWTGALVSAMMDMQLKRAVPAIFMGAIIAGIIVSLATMGIIAVI